MVDGSRGSRVSGSGSRGGKWRPGCVKVLAAVASVGPSPLGDLRG